MGEWIKPFDQAIDKINETNDATAEARQDCASFISSIATKTKANDSVAIGENNPTITCTCGATERQGQSQSIQSTKKETEKAEDDCQSTATNARKGNVNNAAAEARQDCVIKGSQGTAKRK